MSQRDRLETVLNHRDPDRLPFYLMGMPHQGDFSQEFRRREGELLDPYTEDDHNVVLTPCGDFTVQVFFGTDIVVHGEKVEYPKTRWVDEQGRLTDHGQLVGNSEVGLRVNYFGYFEKVEILPNGLVYSWYYGPRLKKEEEWVSWFDDLGWPADMPVGDIGPEINETNTRFRDVIHVIPSYGISTFTHVMMMLGEDRLAYFSRKSPAFLHRLINSMTALQVRQIEKMASLHPVAVFTGDDLGQKDRALLSPAMFHKFFFPNRQRVNEAIHAIGAKSILHCCGNATELLPELVASGLDAWQSLEPASGIDHAAVKQQFGDKLSFWGAVDNNVLCWGSPADVEAEVKRKIKILGANGGYAVGPAHDYLNTKVNNAIILRDAAIKWGKYPLKV